jgi:ATP-binding cassette, subfamily B, bacterial
VTAVIPGASAAGAGGRSATGRQALRELWATSPPLALGVGLWVLANAVAPALVVVALGVVVGEVSDAVNGGLAAFGPQLEEALAVAAVAYGFSLVLDPIGGALGTAARSRITGALQGRLLRAVSDPVGVGHLEDPDVLDRLSRAEGTLTGYFPGDAPVTWAGAVAGRISGVVGCFLVALHSWWIGLGLLVMWTLVRKVLVTAVVRQATTFRGQTPSMRRAWYFTGLASRAPAAKETRVFGLDGFLTDRFAEEFTSAIAAGSAGLRTLRLRSVACGVVAFAGCAAALLAIGLDAGSQGIGITALATLVPMLAVTMSVGSVTMDDITLTWTLAGLPDVDGLERELAPVGLDEKATRAVGERPREAVRFEGVRFHYPGKDDEVLGGLDLELRAGTSLAVVGVNGAGKTTLVSLLSRLREPTAGRITVDGVDLRELDPAAWQRTVAVVFQDPVHYPLSAHDNIAVGAIEHRDDRAGIEEAARQAGFAAVVDTLPGGWDTVLTRELPGGVDLSGGQWQRLALARALFAARHGARILVLDEPTAALDVRGEADFYARFLEITHGLTTVVISHRFATVRRADTVCVLDGGRITERGTHDELVAAGGTYAEMYAVQAARFAETS